MINRKEDIVIARPISKERFLFIITFRKAIFATILIVFLSPGLLFLQGFCWPQTGCFVRRIKRGNKGNAYYQDYYEYDLTDIKLHEKLFSHNKTQGWAR